MIQFRLHSLSKTQPALLEHALHVSTFDQSQRRPERRQISNEEAAALAVSDKQGAVTNRNTQLAGEGAVLGAHEVGVIPADHPVHENYFLTLLRSLIYQ